MNDESDHAMDPPIHPSSLHPHPSVNRAYLLTPPGPGAIAVIRLTGPRTLPFLEQHFSKPAIEGRCVHGDLRDAAGQILDDPVVVLLDAGRAADVSLHG